MGDGRSCDCVVAGVAVAFTVGTVAGQSTETISA
jgi:hypothetical protein